MIADKFNEKKASILYDVIMSVPVEQIKAVDDMITGSITVNDGFVFFSSLTGYSSPPFTYETSYRPIKEPEYFCNVHGKTANVSNYPGLYGNRFYCSECIGNMFDRMGVPQAFACV